MKINLTTLILGVILLAVSFTSIRQCSTSKRYQKAFEAELQENTELESQLYTQSKVRDSLTANIEHLSLEAIQEKTKRKTITASYRRLKTELKATPIEEVYASLIDSLEGETYWVDEEDVYDYGLTKLEMKECNEVVSSLLTENELLELAVKDYSNIAHNLLSNLEDCGVENIHLKKDLKKEKLNEKKLKGKIWSNRSIAGCLGVALLIIVIL